MVAVNDAIAEFYKLRGSYEKALQVRRRKIIRNPALSKGEKLRALSAVTGTCFSCGKKGEMVFRETKTILAVTCGAQPGSCDLDIKIDRGHYVPLGLLLKASKDAVERAKLDIMAIKLDLLFGYSDEEETREKFLAAKQVYDSSTKKLDSNMSLYAQKVENEGSSAAILALRDRISNAKLAMGEIDRDANRVEQMVRIYLDEILPAAAQLRNTQYRLNAVRTEPADQQGVVNKRLVQEVAPYDDCLVPTRPGKVVSFVK